MRGVVSIFKFFIAVVILLVASVAIWSENEFTANSIKKSNAPTPLQACLIAACAARRNAERAACNASANPSQCASLVASDTSANNCKPSQFPRAGSPPATSIETAYTLAAGRCYSGYAR